MYIDASILLICDFLLNRHNRIEKSDHVGNIQTSNTINFIALCIVIIVNTISN